MTVPKPACTFCEGNEGALIISSLDDGDTQIACGVCLPMVALGMAAQLTQGMTIDQANAYAEMLDQIHANDPRPPKPPARGGKRKQAAADPEPPPPDGSETAATVTIELPQPCTQCGATTATGDADKLVCDGCGAVLATADEPQGA